MQRLGRGGGGLTRPSPYIGKGKGSGGGDSRGQSSFHVTDPSKIHITVLGSGTSAGVPTIGCSCDVCKSTDPRDNRLRPSILIRYVGRTVVVDTTPDFRVQVLRAGLERLDAILYTHSHADHILGLDDVRPFNYRQRAPIPSFSYTRPE